MNIFYYFVFADAGSSRHATNSRLSTLAKKKKLDVQRAAKKEKESKSGLWNTLSSSLFGASHASTSEADSRSANDMLIRNNDQEQYLEEASGSEQAGHEVEESDDRIHVFSLATGHMYERLVSFMFTISLK